MALEQKSKQELLQQFDRHKTQKAQVMNQAIDESNKAIKKEVRRGASTAAGLGALSGAGIGGAIVGLRNMPGPYSKALGAGAAAGAAGLGALGYGSMKRQAKPYKVSDEDREFLMAHLADNHMRGRQAIKSMGKTAAFIKRASIASKLHRVFPFDNTLKDITNKQVYKAWDSRKNKLIPYSQRKKDIAVGRGASSDWFSGSIKRQKAVAELFGW